MIALPPKVFLDTQIVAQVEREEISSADWRLASQYLRHATRYCISALTATELLRALAKGSDDHFELHKRRLRILIEPHENAEVFDFIPYYVASELGLPVQRPSHLEDDLLGTICLILSSSSKEKLQSGIRHPQTGHQMIIRLDRFINECDQLKNGYNQMIEKMKQARGPQLEPEQWATGVLRWYGIPHAGEEALRGILVRLSAAYEFEKAVRTHTKNPNFNVVRNSSDQVDGQQLLYLCNSETVFITNDSDFKTRTKRSPQAERIKTFRELLECIQSNGTLL